MADAAATVGQIEAAPAQSKGGRRRLLLAALPVAIVAAGCGAWFSGVAPHLLGLGLANGNAKPRPRVVVDLPEMIANLNSDPRRPRYIKLKAQVELSKPEDVATVNTAMARLQDLFQTYLRELRPEDLQGSAGTYRLRQELIARADVAAAPARIEDVLFVEILVQ
jgi:flagellar FliL protein